MADDQSSSDSPVDRFAGKPPDAARTDDIKPVPTHGKMSSFGGIRRQLTDDELKSPAVQKLLLDMLEEAIRDRDELKTVVPRFHDADKRAGLLAERLNADRAVEVFFASNLALGGIFLGYIPLFWGIDVLYGIMSLVVGIALIVVACAGRLVKR